MRTHTHTHTQLSQMPCARSNRGPCSTVRIRANSRYSDHQVSAKPSVRPRVRRNRTRPSRQTRNSRRAEDFSSNLCFYLVQLHSPTIRLKCCSKPVHQHCVDTWSIRFFSCSYCSCSLPSSTNISPHRNSQQPHISHLTAYEQYDSYNNNNIIFILPY